MNKERVDLNVNKINEKMSEILKECPEILDIAITINWNVEPTEENKDLKIPACIVGTNRKDPDEVAVQTMDLCPLMLNSAQNMYSRLIQALIQTMQNHATDK